MTVQFIEFEGRRLAILAADDYQRLLDQAEEQDDIVAAAAAQVRREAGEEYLPAEMVNRLVDGENALRVWRQYRSMSLNELAERAGVNKAMISQLENDKAFGRPATWRALADTLNVTVDHILPVD
jgi:DNA-binding XRE family transcriptional regulator